MNFFFLADLFGNPFDLETTIGYFLNAVLFNPITVLAIIGIICHVIYLSVSDIKNLGFDVGEIFAGLGYALMLIIIAYIVTVVIVIIIMAIQLAIFIASKLYIIVGIIIILPLILIVLHIMKITGF